MPNPVKHGAWSLRFAAQALLLGVGYGLFHACCFSGPLSTALFAQGLGASGQVLWTQALQLGATVLACLALGALARQGVSLLRQSASYVCYGLVVAGYLLYGALGSVEAIYMLSALIGAAAALPVLLWFDALLHVYRSVGRAQCILILMASTLLFLATGSLVDVVAASTVHGVALVAGGMVVSAACQGGFGRVSGYVAGGDGEVAPRVLKADEATRRSYRLSVYLVAMECSFGVTYGLVRGAVAMSPGGTWPLAWQAALALVALALLVVSVALRPKKAESMHFGLLVRLSLVASGVAFAFAPLLCAAAPSALLMLCDVVFAAQTLAMTFLSIEICHERGLLILEVMPVNFAVFALCAVPAMLFLGAFEAFPVDPLAWNAFTAVGATATVALIPALPSSSSTASVFTLRELPENESYEARAARTRGDMAARYEFSPREREVFDLLVRGMTRSEIAEQLVLSTWTVKQYTASIYAKVGVHSAKELMDCVARG